MAQLCQMSALLRSCAEWRVKLGSKRYLGVPVLGSWHNLRIVGDMATMEGQAGVPIYAIAATDRDNKLW